MKMKKLLSTMLAGAMVLCMSPVVHAQEVDEEIVWEESAPVPTISEDSISARAAWGYGSITSSNPIGSRPKAKANTYTYAGTAYRLWARIDLIDDDDYSTIGPEATGKNVGSVSTIYIESPTEKCDFIGHHEIQDTSTSGTQSATTNKSYN